jgi:hypothetical protein
VKVGEASGGAEAEANLAKARLVLARAREAAMHEPHVGADPSATDGPIR